MFQERKEETFSLVKCCPASLIQSGANRTLIPLPVYFLFGSERNCCSSIAGIIVRFEPESLFANQWNCCSVISGIAVRFTAESLFGLNRNMHSHSTLNPNCILIRFFEKCRGLCNSHWFFSSQCSQSLNPHYVNCRNLLL